MQLLRLSAVGRLTTLPQERGCPEGDQRACSVFGCAINNINHGLNEVSKQALAGTWQAALLELEERVVSQLDRNNRPSTREAQPQQTLGDISETTTPYP